jgi:hypothetical protein
MKYLPVALIAFVVASVITTAHSVEAYQTTGQEAFTVDEHTGVYVINFAFGHGKYDISIPVHAGRSTEKSDTSVSYDVLSNTEETSGSSTGIILSDAPLRDGMYVVPKGKMMNFTLLVFYTPKSTVATEYHLAVTHLPFSFNGTQQLRLNPSELKYYQTESETLRNIFSSEK